MADLPQFTIRKFVVIGSQPNERGRRHLATFVLALGPVELAGCALVGDEDGNAIAHGPRGKNGAGISMCVTFTDAAFARAVARRAAAIYTNSTGEEFSDD